MKRTNILKNKSAFSNVAGAILVLFLLILPPSAAWADDPEMVNIGVDATERLVTVNAILVDAFNERIIEAIETGVPMIFTYTLELVERVDVLPDKTVSRNVVMHTVQYDTLKKVYTFTAAGKGVKSKRVTKQPKRYQELMLTLSNIPLAPLHKLQSNAQYFVRVKAEMDAEDFGFPFNYLLFFVPFNEFETSWAESSTLILEPELSFSQQAEEDDSHPDGPKTASKGLKHVIKSFNQ